MESKDMEISRADAPALSVMSIIDKLASTPTVTMEQVTIVRELVAMQREQEAQQRKERFHEALRLCQSEMPRVAKNGLIDPKGAKIAYAKLEDLDACIRPTYQRHGFSITFDAQSSPDGAKIRNIATFSCAGHSQTLEITASPSNRNTGRLTMTNAQAVKQTITECRRHLQEMFFNIITEDADSIPGPEPITQNQADDIRTRVTDIELSRKMAKGSMLSILCRKCGVEKPEEINTEQLANVIGRVEFEEKSSK